MMAWMRGGMAVGSLVCLAVLVAACGDPAEPASKSESETAPASAAPEATTEVRLLVPGMTCETCSRAVARIVESVPGCSVESIDVETKLVVVAAPEDAKPTIVAALQRNQWETAEPAPDTRPDAAAEAATDEQPNE